MKFDPFKWQEVKPNEELETPQGRVRLRSSKAACFYVTAQGYEVLAEVGHTLDIQCKETLSVRVETDADARIFMEYPDRVSFSCDQFEIFTNMDRKPMESGSVYEVQKAMRQFQIEQHAMRKEMQTLHRQQVSDLKTYTPKPATEPEPAPEPEPQPTTETTKE